ncbi:MAG: winged helix-turn-helix domain-containing protein, partial [Oscillospiraceae bacterium]|nr:winged helix-turn-helix domain-containing protein [Oscillospiraceae bacterium]
MTEWLKRNGFSYRKPHVFPAKAQEEKQAEFISEYEKLK